MADSFITGNTETVENPIVPQQGVSEPPPKTTGGAKIPEKFTSVDDLAEAYKELEKKLGSKGSGGAEAPQTLKIEQPKIEAVANTGTDFDKFTQEYNTTGVLSEQSYKDLEAKGIPKILVDQYISGVKAQAQVAETEFFTMVGGQDEYTKLVGWASENLTPQEINSFNEVAGSGKREAIAFAVQGLKARRDSVAGPRRSVMGQQATGLRPFNSQSAMVQAMRDPRYNYDEDYRSEVEARVRVSPNW